MDEELGPTASFARRRVPWLWLLIPLTLAVALAGVTGAAGQEVGPGKPLRPQLLLIHGGSFLGEDPGFEALTRGPAAAAGFETHYLRYPLGDLPGAVRAARAEARLLRARFGPAVYAYGSSAGGNLAAILAGDGLVSAAAAKAPPSDLVTWDWPLATFGADYHRRIRAGPAALRRLSPFRRPARRPLLVLQGRRDHIVPPAMSEAFAAKFRRVHLWAVPGGHWTERLRPRLLTGAMNWLRRTARAQLPR
jgi:pimeloyl-ACP methyl ester carboxylesterase